MVVWEATLGEAEERRGELETPGWRPLLPSPLRTPASQPFDRIVYGPVASRRLGRSLGVNLTPRGRRVCSFACVYCEYSAAPASRFAAPWPRASVVAEELDAALDRAGPLDAITISGHGEPTLHPRFREAIRALLGVARRRRPTVPVVILSNGSGAVKRAVREGLDLLDERFIKFDASPSRISRPIPQAPLGSLLRALSLLRDVSLQSCFVSGVVSNIDRASVEDWADVIAELSPRRVQIYTIDRAPAAGDIRPVSRELLEEIACRLRDRTGIDAEIPRASAR